MEIMEFCQKVKRSLAAESEEGIKISVKEITKNNGTILHSITISKTGMNISPNIYLDGLYDAYESGRTFRSVMNEVRKIYEESKMESSIDMSFFMDYEKMKEKVVYKVIGYERNKELLRQIPHILFLDMALVFYCYVPKKELDCATILIYDSHLKMWGISKERLYWDAQRNTPHFLPPRILSMEEVMNDIFSGSIMPVSEGEEEMPGSGNPDGAKPGCGQQEGPMPSSRKAEESGKMYVLGNDKKLFGAAAMFYQGVLEEFSEKQQKSFYVLPSSVHEVILIPDDGMVNGEELWKMVCEINATQVEPEEVLTDSVYYFSIKCKKIKKLF